MWEYLLLGAVLLILFAVIYKFLFNQDKKKLVKALNDAGGGNYKYKWFSFNLRQSKPLTAIAVDENNKQVLLVIDKPYKYSFNDIRDIEIVIDEAETVNKSTLNTLGRAAIGGFLLGGVGAVAGAISGSSNVNKKVKKLDLKIKTNSLDTSAHVITFFDSTKDVIGGLKGVEASNPIYVKAVKSLEEWFERFKVISETR